MILATRRIAGVLAVLAAFSSISCSTNRTDPDGSLLPRVRTTQSFDQDWRFATGTLAGAENPAFDDSAWRVLDVPHDWSIEGPFDEKNSPGKAGAFLPGGIGWYRKHFDLAAADAREHYFIDFDGIMANSDVWINGFHLGHRPYGYVAIRYELSGHLNFGSRPNVLTVRCDNSLQPASRWYGGSGIYRHVRLVTADAVHVEKFGQYITTPAISDVAATVHVQSAVVNQSPVSRRIWVRTTLFDAGNRAVSSDSSAVQEIPAGRTVNFQQDLTVTNPQRWDLLTPTLYRAVTQVVGNDEVLDDATTAFGIREFHFDADTGFWLNGKNIKIFGCAIHSEAGAVGIAVPLGVWERRLALLKEVGCNAIRTAHNPPSPEFLDLCDRMGFLVMDEMFDVWTVGKNPLLSRVVLNDYHLYFKDWWRADTSDTILRDRNHPGIILWSAGNEIHDINPNNDLGSRLFVPLRDLYHQLDPTRPVTLAVLRPNASHLYDNGFSELMDVVGQNYRENELLAAHKAKPSRKIIGTENHHDVQTWLYLRDNPAMSGQFLWTGVDYLGESAGWPLIAKESGLFDRSLRARPLAFQRRSWWTTQPLVSIARIIPPAGRAATPAAEPGMDPAPPARAQQLADWTSRQGTGHVENLEVYTNCEQVELLVNGRSLGIQKRHADDSPLIWKVPFEPGDLKAVAYNNGLAVATHELRTAGAPARVVLSADQEKLSPTWDDVTFVRATVTDDHGTPVPDAADLIQFQTTGPGRIAAVDNGDPASHEPFQATSRHAYKGRCVAIIKATGCDGPITLSAWGPGLESASVEIATVPPAGQK